MTRSVPWATSDGIKHISQCSVASVPVPALSWFNVHSTVFSAFKYNRKHANSSSSRSGLITQESADEEVTETVINVHFAFLFQWTALTPAVQHTGCVSRASVTVSQAGAEPTVRSPRPCVPTSVQVMESTVLRPAHVPATKVGLGPTVL